MAVKANEGECPVFVFISVAAVKDVDMSGSIARKNDKVEQFGLIDEGDEMINLVETVQCRVVKDVETGIDGGSVRQVREEFVEVGEPRKRCGLHGERVQ